MASNKHTNLTKGLDLGSSMVGCSFRGLAVIEGLGEKVASFAAYTRCYYRFY